MLPLFTSAILALILMFLANVWVGLTALFIVPIYCWITVRQARKLKGWRRNMRNYREQKNHIFDGTIEENIRYGRPDATLEQVEDAARKAYIYDQIVSLPKGFQSQATELSYRLGKEKDSIYHLFLQYHNGYDECMSDCVYGILPVQNLRFGILITPRGSSRLSR